MSRAAPMDPHWPERGHRVTDLTRAASLIAAEIDRLQRTGGRS